MSKKKLRKVVPILFSLMLIVLVIGTVIAYWHNQVYIVCKLLNDKKIGINCDITKDGYSIYDDSVNVLLGTYPSLMTFTKGDYDFVVAEVTEQALDSFVKNPSRMDAESIVMESILRMSNADIDDMYEAALQDALDFKSIYKYWFPDAKPVTQLDGSYRYAFKTDYSNIDSRLQSHFGGTLMDLVEYKGTTLAIYCLHNDFEEKAGFNDCELNKTVAENPQSFIDDIRILYQSQEDSVMYEYNQCAKKAGEIQHEMEAALDEFKSYICKNDLKLSVVTTIDEGYRDSSYMLEDLMDAQESHTNIDEDPSVSENEAILNEN